MINPRRNNSSFIGAAISAVRDSLGNMPKRTKMSRDSLALRWAKFFSIIIVPAVILGSIFAFEEYQTKKARGVIMVREIVAKEVFEKDPFDSIRVRFVIGASVGSCIGTIFVIRCLVRKVDP